MSLLTDYMNKHLIKFELQSRIRNYLEYMWEKEMELHQNEIEFLISKLSSSLSDELNHQVKGKVFFEESDVLSQFSKELLKEVSSIIQEERYAPEELVIRGDSQDDTSIYIVKEG